MNFLPQLAAQARPMSVYVRFQVLCQTFDTKGLKPVGACG
jgi:hypothetical protein